MIKSYTINIMEVDEIEFALEELEEQLKDITLLKNTVGVVSVHIDYINSGVYAAVAKALGFPLIGGTSLAAATGAEIGVYLFSIIVLTSNDCAFSYAVSEGEIPASGESVADVTRECYEKAINGLEGTLALTFLFVPFKKEYHCASEYVKAASAFNDRVPVFGTLTIAELENDFTHGRTVLNGDSFDNKVAILTLSGNVQPAFYIESVSDSSVTMPNIGTVTKSDANIVTEINHTGINEFFAKIGYDPGDMVKGAQTTGFIVSERDKSGEQTTSRFTGILRLIDGAGIFGNDVPEGSVLSIATTSKEDIMATAESLIGRIKENHDGGTLFIFSCAGRMFSLLNEPMKEYTHLRNSLSGDFNFMAVCSGGEMCPTLMTEDRAYNNGHNNTIVVCAL
jgi:hypothetical protein